MAESLTDCLSTRLTPDIVRREEAMSQRTDRHHRDGFDAQATMADGQSIGYADHTRPRVHGCRTWVGHSHRCRRHHFFLDSTALWARSAGCFSPSAQWCDVALSTRQCDNYNRSRYERCNNVSRMNLSEYIRHVTIYLVFSWMFTIVWCLVVGLGLALGLGLDLVSGWLVVMHTVVIVTLPNNACVIRNYAEKVIEWVRVILAASAVKHRFTVHFEKQSVPTVFTVSDKEWRRGLR